MPMEQCVSYIKPRWFVLHLSVSPYNAISFIFCRFITCLWTQASWTTHILSTPLITGTTLGSLDWSRANPCHMSLTYGFLSISEAPVWREEPCKCVYVHVSVCCTNVCVSLFVFKHPRRCTLEIKQCGTIKDDIKVCFFLRRCG